MVMQRSRICLVGGSKPGAEFDAAAAAAKSQQPRKKKLSVDCVTIRPAVVQLPPAHLPPGQRHNRKGHQQTARQGSCDQRKKVWQEPNPENPHNYKRGGGPRALDPPTRLKTHPPRPPPHCNLILINEAWSVTATHAHTG